MSVKATFFFHLKTTTNKFWNDAEMLLKSFWTSHLQMMNGLEPIFKNWTGRRKGVPKGVDETHLCYSLNSPAQPNLPVTDPSQLLKR